MGQFVVSGWSPDVQPGEVTYVTVEDREAAVAAADSAELSKIAAEASVADAEAARDAAIEAASAAAAVGTTNDTIIAAQIESPSSETTGATVGTLSAVTPQSQAVLDHLVTGVRPELYGAVGDGVTNDTAAFAALLADGHCVIDLGPKPYLIDPDVLDIPTGGLLRGVGSSGYQHGAEPTQFSKIIIKSTVGAEGTWGVRIGIRGGIQNVAIYPSGTLPSYQDADYPAGTGNTPTGLYLMDRGVTCTDVLVTGFSEIGIRAGTTSKLVRCYVRSCPVGYSLDGTDGWMDSCVAMFCMNVGIETNAAFWRFTSNRIEWNARYGLQSAGHATIIGNLFDRNGWAGLYLPAGSWGQVVTGNHFHRNGCGGDGAEGRWGASIPGHISYVATTRDQSCHIMIDYQRSATIAGNRFSTGRDDSNQGMNSPALIYSSSTTTTGTAVYASSNVGSYGPVLGYVAAAYSSTGAICGGADTTMTAHLTRPMSVQDGYETLVGVKAGSFGVPRTRSANTSSYAITLSPGRAGMVIISGRNSANSSLTVVYFSQDTVFGNKSTVVENKIGTVISAAVLTNDGTNDILTLTATGSRNWNFQIVYSDN